MAVYWDPSAWVKVYVKELYHEATQAYFEATELPISSLLSYVEIHAALAAMERDRRFSMEQLETVRAKIDDDWVHFIPVLVDPTLTHRAAALARRFALRGYDSVHLASADSARTNIDEHIVIASFDKPLISAAREMGFQVWTQ